MSSEEKRVVGEAVGLPEQGAEFARRRRVIRGLVSVPVALTLANGAALASTSIHQCLTNENSTPADCVTSENAADPNWLYSEFKNVKPAGTNLPEKYCVIHAKETDDHTDWKLSGYRYTHANEVYYIDKDGETSSAGAIGNPLRASCAGSFMT